MTCIDVGCGCGVLAVQMALNGAELVEAIDIDPAAVANTLANGGLNGIGEQAHRNGGRPQGLASATPLRPRGREPLPAPRRPERRGAARAPTGLLGPRAARPVPAPAPRDPDSARPCARPAAVDHRAERTAELLAELGLEARIVDFGFFPFGPLFSRNAEQIAVVESCPTRITSTSATRT